MAKTFSKQAEDLLINAVRKVASYVEEEGLSPTDAVVKTAEEINAPREYLPLMVHAYNQGKAASHRQGCENGDTLCKVASYPIADLTDVQRKLYPETIEKPASILEKTAVSEEYSRPPRTPVVRVMNKEAGCCKPKAKPKKPSKAQKKAEYEVARREAGNARDALNNSLYDIADYFKKVASQRLPFGEVRFNAERLFGPAAGHALDFASQMACVSSEKRASVLKPVDLEKEPYSLVKKACELAKVALDKMHDMILLEEPAAKKKSDDTVKQASGVVGGVLSGAAGGALSGMLLPPSTSSLVEKTRSQLNSPDHLNSLRAIHAQAMLSDLIRNDEVLSGYDPSEVMEAYNEIAALSPRAAVQPSVMRPMLRKRLTAGAVEPFEAQQLTGLEKDIKSIEGMPGSNVLGKGPGDQPNVLH